MPQAKEPTDGRVAIPLDPETALRALLKVDPESEPVDEHPEADRREATVERRERDR